MSMKLFDSIECDSEGFSNIQFQQWGINGTPSEDLKKVKERYVEIARGLIERDSKPPVSFDATMTPLEKDRIRYGKQIPQLFMHQIEMADALPHYTEPIEYDGREQIQIPTEDDIDDPVYAMEPGEHRTALAGGLIVVPTPQLYLTARRSKDKWKLTFAGKARVPRLMVRMRDKIRQHRDIKLLRGDTGIDADIGIANKAYSITTTGAMDVEDDSDGRLSHMIELVQDYHDYFATKGYSGRPIVWGMTSYFYNLLMITEPTYKDGNNLDLMTRICPRGSRLLDPSDNLQASVTANANTLVGVLDLGISELQGITLIEGGVQQVAKEMGMWDFSYGIRQMTVSRVIDVEKVCKTASVDTTT